MRLDGVQDHFVLRNAITTRGMAWLGLAWQGAHKFTVNFTCPALNFPTTASGFTICTYQSNPEHRTHGP